MKKWMLPLIAVAVTGGCTTNTDPYEGAQVAFESDAQEDAYELEVEKKRLENRIEYLEREAMRLQSVDNNAARRNWIEAAKAKEELTEINKKLAR